MSKQTRILVAAIRAHDHFVETDPDADIDEEGCLELLDTIADREVLRAARRLFIQLENGSIRFKDEKALVHWAARFITVVAMCGDADQSEEILAASLLSSPVLMAAMARHDVKDTFDHHNDQKKLNGLFVSSMI